MPTINGRFYSSFGSSSGYQQLQIERAQNTAARQQAESDASALGDVMSGASQDLAQGLANLAAQAALARINNEASAKQATSGASTDSTDTSDTLAPTEGPVIAVDAAMHGITDLLPEVCPQPTTPRPTIWTWRRASIGSSTAQPICWTRRVHPVPRPTEATSSPPWTASSTASSRRCLGAST